MANPVWGCVLFTTVTTSVTTLTPHPHPCTPKPRFRGLPQRPHRLQDLMSQLQLQSLRSATTLLPLAPGRPHAILRPPLHTDRGTPGTQTWWSCPGSLGLGPLALALSQSTPLLGPNQLFLHVALCPHFLPSSGPGPSVAGRPQRQLPSLLPWGPQASCLPSTKPNSASSPKPPLLTACCSPRRQAAPVGRPYPSPHP